MRNCFTYTFFVYPPPQKKYLNPPQKKKVEIKENESKYNGSGKVSKVKRKVRVK